MDLIDKQDIPFLQGRKDGCQITGLFDTRTGRRLDIGTHLVGQDIGHCRLA